MAITDDQLGPVADTLRLVTDAAGPVQPGQLVQAQVVSSLTDLKVVDSVGSASVPLSLPVELNVTWKVTDHNNRELQPGVDFVASNGLAGPLVGFVFKPPIVELTRSPVLPVPWRISARAELKVGPASYTRDIPPSQVPSQTRDLPAAIDVVQLEIPRLVALFRHKFFSVFEDKDNPGFVLMLVPYHSILQGLSEPFNDLMEKIDAALQPLRMLAGIADLLTGLATLRQALARQPMVRLKRGNVDELRNIHMRVDTLWGWDWGDPDQRADDEVSSLIVLGPCGSRVAFFQDQEQDISHGEWAFDVVVGPEMIVVLRDLHSKPPPALPEHDPAVPSTQRVFMRHTNSDSLGDNMSSVDWDPEPTEEEATNLPDPCSPIAAPTPVPVG